MPVGGIIRDLLAGRIPLVFKKDIYAVWPALEGLLIGLGIFQGNIALYFLFVIITGLRILSLTFHWQLPNQKFIK